MNQNTFYKNSGIEWVGKIPDSWVFKRLKYMTNVQLSSVDRHINEDEKKVNICHYPNVYYNEKIKSETKLEYGSCSENEYKKFKLIKDDVIITKDSESPNDIGVPTYVEEELTDTVCGYHLSLIRTHGDELLGGLLLRFIQSKKTCDYFNVHSNGVTRFGIGKHIIENLYVPFPRPSEQNIIIDFLNTKTQKIDELTKKTEKKIELLKEKRTSLINHCVTKGLNPNVEMKDSGVEWIGEIPSHWVVSKFKYLSEIVTGNTPSKTDEELYYTDSEDSFLWVKPTSLNKGLDYVNESVEHLTEEGKNLTRVIPKDSTMICCIGNTIGKHSISGQKLSTNQQINSVIPNQEKLHPWYCLFYVNVFTRDLLKWSNIVTLPIYNKSDLEDTSFILPPFEEQTQIVEKLIHENHITDTTIEKETQRIELLKEYRESLISKVVTGKIDVRDWKK